MGKVNIQPGELAGLPQEAQDQIKQTMGLGHDAELTPEALDRFADSADETQVATLQGLISGQATTVPFSRENYKPFILTLIQRLRSSEIIPFNEGRIYRHLSSITPGVHYQTRIEAASIVQSDKARFRVLDIWQNSIKKRYVVSPYGDGLFICCLSEGEITIALTHKIKPNPLDVLSPQKTTDAKLQELLRKESFLKPESLDDSGYHIIIHPDYGPILVAGFYENETEDSPYIFGNSFDPALRPFMGASPIASIENPWDPINLPDEVKGVQSAELLSLAKAIVRLKKSKTENFDGKQLALSVIENPHDYLHYTKANSDDVYIPFSAQFTVMADFPLVIKVNRKTGETSLALVASTSDDVFRLMQSQESLAIQNSQTDRKLDQFNDWLASLLDPSSIKQFLDSLLFLPLQELNSLVYVSSRQTGIWILAKQKDKRVKPPSFTIFDEHPESATFFSNAASAVSIENPHKRSSKWQSTKQLTAKDKSYFEKILEYAQGYLPFNEQIVAQWILNQDEANLLDTWSGSTQIRYLWSIIHDEFSEEPIGLIIYRVENRDTPHVSVLVANASNKVLQAIANDKNKNELARILAGESFSRSTVFEGTHRYFYQDGLGFNLLSQDENGAPKALIPRNKPEFNQYFAVERLRPFTEDRLTLTEETPLSDVFTLEGFKKIESTDSNVIFISGKKYVVLTDYLNGHLGLLSETEDKLTLDIVRNETCIQEIKKYLTSKKPLNPHFKLVSELHTPLIQINTDIWLADGVSKRWQFKGYKNQLTIRTHTNETQVAINHFVLGPPSLQHYLDASRSNNYAGYDMYLRGIKIPCRLLQMRDAGRVSYAILLIPPDAHPVFISISPEKANEIIANQGEDVLEDTDHDTMYIFRPDTSEFTASQADQHFKMTINESGMVLTNPAAPFALETWSFVPWIETNTDFIDISQMRNLKSSDLNVLPLTKSNGKKQLYIQMESPWGIALLELVKNDIVLHLFPYQGDQQTIKLSSDLLDNPLHAHVLTKGGKLLTTRIPLNQEQTLFLAIDPDRISIVETLSESRERTHTFEFANRMLDPISFDPLNVLNELAAQINQLSPNKNIWPIALNEQDYPDSQYPIRVTLKDSGGRNLSVSKARKATDTLSATIQWGGNQASKIKYKVGVSGRQIILSPNETHAPEGNIIITTNESGESSLSFDNRQSAISRIINENVLGPQFSLHFKDNDDGTINIRFKGDFDLQGFLLQQLINIWIHDEEKRPEVNPQNNSWEFDFNFDRSKADYIIGAMAASKLIYAALLGKPSEFALKIEKEPTAPKTPLPKPKTIESKQRLPNIAGTPDRYVIGQFFQADKGEPWTIKSLTYNNQNLLAETDLAHLKITQVNESTYSVLATHASGWESFTIKVNLADHPSIEIKTHNNINRESVTQTHHISVFGGVIEKLSMDIQNNPLTEKNELHSLSAMNLFGVTEIMDRLPVKAIFPLKIKIKNNYLGIFELTIQENEDKTYSIQWPQIKYTTQLQNDGTQTYLRLAVGGMSHLDIPLITTNDNRYILSAASLKQYNTWQQLTGNILLEEGSYEVCLRNGVSHLVKTYLNQNGSYAPNQWPHQEQDLDLIRNNKTQFTQAPFFHATDWQIHPGQIFLPTKNLINKLKELFMEAKKQGGHLAISDSGTYDLALDSGFGLKLPYTIVARPTNPFKLDANGIITLDAIGIPQTDVDHKPILDGRRISAFINSPMGTHEWVADESLSAFDQGGNWVITIVTPNGSHQLTMVRHPIAPSLMALVDTSEVQGDEKARSTLLYQTKQILVSHVDDILKGKTEQLPYVISEISESDGQVVYTGQKMGQNGPIKLFIEGVRYKSGELILPHKLTLRTQNNSISREIQCEVEVSGPHTLRLRDVTQNYSNDIYLWDRKLNILYREATSDKVGEINRTNAELILKNNGFPIRDKRQPETEPELRHVTEPTDYILSLDHLPPLMPESQKGFSFPGLIKKVTDAASIATLLERIPLHDLVFVPTEADAITLAFKLQNQKMMSFVTQSGAILQLPMRSIDSPHNYTVDWDFATQDHLIGARLLLPDPDQKGAYIELSVSPKEKIHSGSSAAEVTLNLSHLPKVNLKLSRSESKLATHTVFAYHMMVDRKKSQISASNLKAEIDTWVRYLRLHTAPDLYDASVLAGFDDLVLSDDSLLELGLTKKGNQLVLQKLAQLSANAFRPAKVHIEALMSTHADEDINLELYPESDESRIFYIRNPLDNSWDYFVLTPRGDLKIWNRPHHIKEFMTPPAAVDFKMTAIEGHPYGYKNGGVNLTPEEDIKSVHSVATRLRLTDPQEPTQQFEISTLMGRWNGATPTAFTPDSSDKFARLRFVVSVSPDGALTATPGKIKDTERENNAKFPWGEDFKIEVLEDEWLDENREVKKGRIRIIFYNPNHPKKQFAPYGWMEFINREALIGSANHFAVDLAHHHETNQYADKKLFGSDNGFLSLRAGVKNKVEFDFKAIFESLGDKAQDLLSTLATTHGRHEDILCLVDVLKKLVVHKKLTDIYDAAKNVKEELLRDLAQYALETNPSSAPGSTGGGTKGSGSRTRAQTSITTAPKQASLEARFKELGTGPHASRLLAPEIKIEPIESQPTISIESEPPPEPSFGAEALGLGGTLMGSLPVTIPLQMIPMGPMGMAL